MEIITDKISNYDEQWWDNFYSKHYHEMSDSDRLHFEIIGDIVGDKKVIDIGCGQGHLSQFVENYTGIDWSGEAVNKATERYGSKFLIGDIPTSKYDYAVMCEVFEHLENPKEFVEKLKENADWVIITIPNGIMGKLVVESDTELMKTISEHTKYHYAIYEKEDIESMFEKVSFIEVDKNHLMFIV